MVESDPQCKDSSNRTLLHATILVLSSYVGLFFAYIIQQSSALFSYSVELTSYITANKLVEFEDMAYGLVKECYGFSDQNLTLVVLGLASFALLGFSLELEKSLFKTRSTMLLSAIAFVSIVVWFVEPLIVIFSSIESSNVFLVGWGKIPNSDAATIGKTLGLLDRFRLFSRGFFFSSRLMVFASFIPLSTISLSRLLHRKNRIWKRILSWVVVASPAKCFYFSGSSRHQLICGIFLGTYP